MDSKYIQISNEVVGYYDKKMIVRDDYGELYFVPCEDEDIANEHKGCMMPIHCLWHISQLSKLERNPIISIFGGENNGI